MVNRSITARIRGGLGNQLFIYAMARRLAVKNDIPLNLDIVSGFKNDGYRRRYLLYNFNIKAIVATSRGYINSIFDIIRLRICINSKQISNIYNRQYIIENDRSFDPGILNCDIRNFAYVDGLWQSEHYFKDIEDVIRTDLELITPRNSATIKAADKINNANAISLHWRSYSEVPPIDGSPALNVDYYKKAIEHITQKINNPHFFCFSDHPDWLKANLDIDFPLTYVSKNTGNEDEDVINDLYLMSQCKHHIIANSTFSWWGAWLNKNLDKIVVAPKCEWQNPDYIPNDWITI